MFSPCPTRKDVRFMEKKKNKILPMHFHQVQFDLCSSVSSVLCKHTEVHASGKALL